MRPSRVGLPGRLGIAGQRGARGTQLASVDQDAQAAPASLTCREQVDLCLLQRLSVQPRWHHRTALRSRAAFINDLRCRGLAEMYRSRAPRSIQSNRPGSIPVQRNHAPERSHERPEACLRSACHHVAAPNARLGLAGGNPTTGGAGDPRAVQRGQGRRVVRRRRGGVQSPLASRRQPSCPALARSRRSNTVTVRGGFGTSRRSRASRWSRRLSTARPSSSSGPTRRRGALRPVDRRRGPAPTGRAAATVRRGGAGGVGKSCRA
jgi:hypothetical protein